jgi:diadenosine tetraphosphate (Ap4A) HIT family hydrolase
MSSSSGCMLCDSLSRETPVWENDLWHLRPIEKPTGVAGWMILVSKRHVSGPADFNHEEARSFGPTLAHFSRVLRDSTGALRIYTAALGEAVPHFHCHLIPRMSDAPKIGWGLFDTQRMAKAGELSLDEAVVDKVVAAFARAIASDPLPDLA